MKERLTPKPKLAYHHGDLRRALVDAAVQLIGEAGIESLTLREIGLRVGVSRAAPYRHFRDKADLLAAVAHEGFRLLRRDLEAVLATTQAGEVEMLVALSKAYVGFGVQHPTHYRTMFGLPWGNKGQYPALAKEGEATSQILVESIIRGQAAGQLVPGHTHQIARVVWSLLHGVVMLREDEHFSGSPTERPEDPFLAGFAMITLLSGLLVHADA